MTKSKPPGQFTDNTYASDKATSVPARVVQDGFDLDAARTFIRQLMAMDKETKH